MLGDLRQAIYELIQADEYYTDAGAVLALEDKGDIGTLVASEVSKLGLYIEVLMIGAGNSNQRLNSTQFDEIYPVVMFYEMRSLNTGAIHALDLAEHFYAQVKELNGWLVPDEVPLDADEGLCIELVPNEFLVQYGVRLFSQGQIAAEFDQVATPVITETDGNITITCATAPAAIYYTLDGTEPHPGNPAAAHYTGLFNPAGGLQLKAQGWASGYLASEIAGLAETAGGGDGIGNEFVTIEQFIALWNAQSGNTKFSANGDLILETREATQGDRTLHQVHVTKAASGQPVSVVADDEEAVLP